VDLDVVGSNPITRPSFSRSINRDAVMKRLLRCYAERRHRTCEAFCIDFDLAVQGEPFEEVYQSLNRAIADYVDRVQELPIPDRERLLRRSAPLSEQLIFLLSLLRSALRSHGSDDDEKHEYTLPCVA
jgi:hypothetical protein